MGPNGAGKTTLLRVLSGLARPTRGRLLFDGSAADAAGRLRPRVGYLSHQALLYDGLTARQNLTFFGRLYGVAAPRERAGTLLRQFELEPHADRTVGSLSRGLQQRLSLARALVHSPAILLLDEPHAGLDARGARLLSEGLLDLKRRGTTVVIATHLVEVSLELADRVAVLAAGELRHTGPRGALSPAELGEVYATATGTRV